MNNVFLNDKNKMIEVTGAVHFNNVMALYEQGVICMRTLPEVKVDLKHLTESDSSGLALLTAWVREARQQKKGIQFINMPNFMYDILRVCGLDGVLPVLWEN